MGLKVRYGRKKKRQHEGKIKYCTNCNCGKGSEDTTPKLYYFRDGTLCEQCIGKSENRHFLVQEFNDLSIEEFNKAKKLFVPLSHTSSKYKHKSYKNISVCDDGLILYYEKTVQFLEYEHISSIRHKFVPQKQHILQSCLTGNNFLLIITKNPKIIIWFKLENELVKVKYHYEKRNYIVELADEVIDIFNTSLKYHHKYIEAKKAESKGYRCDYNDWESNEASEKQQEKERQEREQREKERRERQKREQRESTQNINLEYERALALFMLKTPFTITELKKQRNMLIKSFHPDEGGTSEYAQHINNAFDVLKKYAS